MMFVYLVISYLFPAVFGMCFFPVEFQGIFATQSTLTQGDRHRYSEITILPDGIPIWGVCRRRMGNTVILHDSTGGQQCMRCFHLYLRSPNVIQVYTEGIDRCYDTEAAATTSCPSMQDIRSLRAREIMLYKSRSFNQDGRISRVMCPFVGRYYFSYGAFDGRRRSDMCLDLSSHLSSCPRASQVKLSFRDCTFGELDLQLECLGSWTGFDDIKYLALFDPDIKSDKQPKYRCAMFHEADSGRVSMSLSVDSSCHRQLTSPWQGFESLSLTPFTPPSPPAANYGRSCNFPDWMQGEWQDMKIKGETLEFRDEATDQLISGRCIAEASPKGERFALYTTNQCGEESYRCVWIKSRSENVFEFVLSHKEDKLNTSTLCADDRFWKSGWLTQGRKLRGDARCPISGEFIGVLPDDTNLCARLTSDCENPHFMHYTVFPCNNDTIPYEERFYQCLGQWKEAGVTYTYTWRRDVHNHECFAGVVVSDDEVFIIEAGTTCRRGLQPLANGMKIVKRNTCSELEANRNTATREEESNDVVNSIDKSFSSNVGAKWNSLGESPLQLYRSYGSKPDCLLLNNLIILILVLIL